MVQLFWPPDNTVLSEEANRRCFWLPTQPRETSEAEKEIEHTEGRAAQHTEVSSTCNHSALWFCSPTWEKDWGVCSHHLCLEWMNTFPGLLPFIKTKHNIQMKCFLFGSSGFYKIALQCKRPLSLLLCSLLFKEKGLSPLLPLFVPRTFASSCFLALRHKRVFDLDSQFKLSAPLLFSHEDLHPKPQFYLRKLQILGIFDHPLQKLAKPSQTECGRDECAFPKQKKNICKAQKKVQLQWSRMVPESVMVRGCRMEHSLIKCSLWSPRGS